jgi:hypothetical protein
MYSDRNEKQIHCQNACECLLLSPAYAAACYGDWNFEELPFILIT